MGDDKVTLLKAMKRTLLAERPDLIDAFLTLSQEWQAPPSRWPAAPLTTTQHRMANDGLLSMNAETCRWNVKLSQLLAKPEPPPPLAAPAADPLVGSTAAADSELTSMTEVWLQKLGPIIEASAASGYHIRDSGWQGVLARVDKKRTPIRLLQCAGPLLAYVQPLNGVLSISLRSPHDEMLKKEFVAFGFLQNARPTEAAVAHAFVQYIAYFEERNRAGVVRITEADHTMIYVIPLSVAGLVPALAQYGLQLSGELLMIIVAKTGPSK